MSQKIETYYWKLDIPKSWIDLSKKDEGSYHFQSDDELAAIYLIVYQISPDVTIDDEFGEYLNHIVKESFGLSDKETSFQVLDESTRIDDNILQSALIIYSKEREMKVFTKQYVKNKMLYKISLHDYNCSSTNELSEELVAIEKTFKMK